MRRVYPLLLALAVVLGCSDSTSPKVPPGPSATLSDLGTMNVGDVRVVTFAQAAGGLMIPAALDSAQYVIVAANTAGDTGSVPQFTVSGDVQRAAPSLPQNQQQNLQQNLAVPSPFSVSSNRMGGALGTNFRNRLRAYEQSHLHPAAYRAPAATRHVTSALRGNFVPAGTVPVVGSMYQFNVPKNSDSICTSANGFATVTAEIMSVSSHAIIAVDTSALNTGFTTASYDSIADEFDTYIFPTEVGYFGPTTDLDNNGHVFILYTPQVNLVTPAGQAATQGYVGGFTFAGDFFSRLAPPTGCLESNEGEIFYLMVPDPTNRWGNVFTTDLVREQTRVTMGHELQHAINDGTRLVNNANDFESAWLDEALSSLGEDLIGRAELGGAGASYGDLDMMTLATMQTIDQNIYSTFFGENFARTQLYVSRPDTVGALVTNDREESDLAAFGAGWAFLRYVVDWYSHDAPRTFTTALVAGPDTGTANLTAHAGAPLDSLLAHWLVTMYTDGQNIPGLPAQYNYRTYAMRAIVSHLCADIGCHSSLPYLPITPVGDDNTHLTVGIPSSSANYFITSQTPGGARSFTVTNTTGGAATYPYGRLYVVRVH